MYTLVLVTGRLDIAPKRASTKRSHDEALKLTKAINTDNEQLVVGLASKAGGPLALVSSVRGKQCSIGSCSMLFPYVYPVSGTGQCHGARQQGQEGSSSATQMRM